jgi:hypothetical protein
LLSSSGRLSTDPATLLYNSFSKNARWRLLSTPSTTASVVAVESRPGRAHAFRVDSERARVLGLSVPGGHEQFFRLAGDPAGHFDLGAGGTVPPNMDRMAAAAAATHVQILGPPPFETDI